MQSTFMQLGGVLGSAVLGSVLASRVGSVLVDKLVGAGVPPSVAPRFQAATEFVSQGVAPVDAQVAKAGLAQAVTEGSHAAFMSGLHVALIVAAALALLGACLAPLIRRGESPVEGAVAI